MISFGNRLYSFFASVLVILFIIPLIYVTQFVFPSGDDICRAGLSLDHFFENFKEWYFFHNGRYINAVFSLLPVYGITIYRIVLALQFIILGLVLYRFVSRVHQFIGIKGSPACLFFVSVLFYLLLLAQLPSLFEAFYWYASVTAYLWSFIFFLFFLELVLKFYIWNKLSFFPLALLIILINGNNEILLGITNFLLLALLCHDFLRRRRWNIRLIILNLISWISSLAVILSPGTAARRGEFDYGGNFIGSAKVAILYGGKFVVESFFQFPFVLFYLFIFLYICQKAKKSGENATRKIKPLTLLGISYISIVSIFFILYYAKGLLGIRNGRIGNITIMISSIFFLLNVINLAIFYKEELNFRFLRSELIPVGLALILVFFLILPNGNFYNLREDITDGSLVTYQEEMNERLKSLKETKKDTILLNPIEGTRILKSDDPALETQDWLRSCYINHFRNNGNTSIKNFKIEKH